jgi:hypothetical protein
MTKAAERLFHNHLAAATRYGEIRSSVVRSAPRAFRAMAAAALAGLVCLALADEAQAQLRVADLTPVTLRKEGTEPILFGTGRATRAVIS